MKNMRVIAAALLALSTQAHADSIDIKAGGGYIEGYRTNSADDTLLSLQLNYSHSLSQRVDLEAGMMGAGAFPVFSQLFSDKSADFDNYFVGVRGNYPVNSFLSLYASGGAGYGTVSEYARVKGEDGSYHDVTAHKYSGLSPYISAGFEMRPFNAVGFTADVRYDDLPHGYSSTNVLFGMKIYV
ncbi:outer membrane beta-barrel protein [Enterovibrio coralii]|uniref:Outer membrane protein beta-barrel domain-containing protein n=1 Tax=Enterovibrio coralii TaxID=294935 RepID=A0A135I9G3_9GAMM|nr:outer membrane beta-barrel protein [Enterovibrio coralii]KXF82095.1 hypothetical protein ATN88_20080 [Enterovibrio coralii]